MIKMKCYREIRQLFNKRNWGDVVNGNYYRVLGRNIVALILLWPVAAHAEWFGPDCDISQFNKSEKVRHVDKSSSISIAVPNSWSVSKKKENSYSEMLVKSGGSCKITIFISSRPLENNEKRVTAIHLVDSMLQSSLNRLRSQGHQIVNYGKFKEFKPGWPSFVIVSGESGGKRMATSYGTIIENRNFAIIVLTKIEQNSEGLADILRKVIDSIEMY